MNIWKQKNLFPGNIDSVLIVPLLRNVMVSNVLNEIWINQSNLSGIKKQFEYCFRNATVNANTLVANDGFLKFWDQDKSVLGWVLMLNVEESLLLLHFHL